MPYRRLVTGRRRRGSQPTWIVTIENSRRPVGQQARAESLMSVRSLLCVFPEGSMSTFRIFGFAVDDGACHRYLHGGPTASVLAGGSGAPLRYRCSFTNAISTPRFCSG